MADKPKMKRLTSLPSTKMGYVSDYMNERNLNLTDRSKAIMRRKPYSTENVDISRNDVK